MTKPKVTLIDAPGLVCRSYFAIPPLHTSTGIQTNAVYGFARTILAFLRDNNPTHIGLCFDLNSRKGRQAIDPMYKSNRDVAPDELRIQFDLVREFVTKLGMKVVEYDGWEADDVVGTLTKRAAADGYEVEIITSDKDFMQLVDDNVHIWDPGKNKHIYPADVLLKYGVSCSQMIDYQALIGDSIDNVPNVPGVGPATAAKLLKQFGSVNEMLAHAGEIKQNKLRGIIEQNAFQIERARQLVSFRCELELGLTTADLARGPIDLAGVTEFLEKLEFSRRLMPLVEGLMQ